MPVLFILFVVMPILEMWVLIEVGARIGALPTIGLVLLTAMIGLALLRQQGFSTLSRANLRMQSGEIPAQEMAEGIFLAVGGALLLTPGFITDSIGFACLIPGLRRWMLGRVLRHWQVVQVRRYQSRGGPFNSNNPFDGQHRPGANERPENRTIEGDFHRDD